MTEHTPDQMVSIAEAAMRLRLSREQIIRRIQQGTLAGGKVFGHWYVDRQAVDRAIEQGVRDPRAASV